MLEQNLGYSPKGTQLFLLKEPFEVVGFKSTDTWSGNGMIYSQNPTELIFFCGLDRHRVMGQIFQNLGPQFGL